MCNICAEFSLSQSSSTSTRISTGLYIQKHLWLCWRYNASNMPMFNHSFADKKNAEGSLMSGTRRVGSERTRIDVCEGAS